MQKQAKLTMSILLTIAMVYRSQTLIIEEQILHQKFKPITKQQLRIDPIKQIKNRQQKYLACTDLPHVTPMVNNNSISTAVPDNKYLYMAVTGRITQIYRFPIKKSNQNQSQAKFQNKPKQHQHLKEDYNNFQPFQTLKQSTMSSAVSFSEDGLHLAAGSSSGNTHIYVFDGTQYPYKQTLKNSYYSNGGRVLFSSQGQTLFTIQSTKQINIYIQGANTYQLLQTIPINIQSFTIYALTHDLSYFTVVQLGATTFLLSVFEFSQQSNKYVRFGQPKPVSQLISDVSMNNNFVVVAIGTLRVNCSTLIYKISKQKRTIEEFQQIYQPSGAYCIISNFITNRNELVLTNIYTTSFVYGFDNQKNSFQKKYQFYHQAQGSPIHTQLRLIDSKYEHLLVYTGVQINMYCPGVDTKQ